MSSAAPGWRVGAGLLVVASIAAVGSTLWSHAAGEGRRYAFRRVQADAELGAYTRTWGAAWLDHDRDGDPDAFLGRHQFRPWFLLRTRHGFRVALDGTFGRVDRHNCAWGEANGDGEPDLFCTVGAFQGKGEGPNQLFVRTDGGYDERATESGVAYPKARGRSVNWIDFDSDGDLDIFVGNKQRRGAPAAMFRNDLGRFTSVEAGVSEPDVANSTWADWDNDGDPDLLLLRGIAPAIAYENAGGIFRRVAIPPLTTKVWKSASWGDYDGDGWIDLHLLHRNRAIVVRNASGRFDVVDRRPIDNGRGSVWFDAENDGDLDVFIVQGAPGFHPDPDAINRPDIALLNSGGRFRRLRHAVLNGPRRGTGGTATVADFNRDGRVDILVTNGFQASPGPLWLIRNATDGGRWIGIDVVGPPTNPLGYGTRITVTTAFKTLHAQLTDAVGFRSQSEVGYATFGVGSARRVDIEIEWPDGTKNCYRSRTRRQISVEHGSDLCL